MSGAAVQEAGGAHGVVTVREYSLADARQRWPGWDGLDHCEKARRVDALEPESETTTSNVIVDEWFEHLVDLMDQTQGNTAEEVTHFAVGTDNTSPQTTDTSLGNEVYRTTLDDETDNGKDYDCQGFLDSTEANGNTLEEVALFTGTSGGSTLMVNHASITSTDKNNQKLVTISFTVKYRDT